MLFVNLEIMTRNFTATRMEDCAFIKRCVGVGDD